MEFVFCFTKYQVIDMIFLINFDIENPIFVIMQTMKSKMRPYLYSRSTYISPNGVIMIKDSNNLSKIIIVMGLPSKEDIVKEGTFQY